MISNYFTSSIKRFVTQFYKFLKISRFLQPSLSKPKLYYNEILTLVVNMPFTWISVFRSWWAMLENISTDKELGPYWTTAVWNDTHLCVINIRNLQKTRISKILHLLNTNLLLEACTHHLLIKHEHICYCIYCQQVLVGSPLQKRTEYHLNDTVLKPELQSETLAASHVFHNKKVKCTGTFLCKGLYI